MATEVGPAFPMSFVISWGLRIFFNFVGFFGLALIIYEIIAAQTGSRWTYLDAHSDFLSAFLTLMGTLFTATGIFVFPVNTTPPEKLSYYVVAPIIIAATILALVLLFRNKTIPGNVINGFALLAISGGFMRLQPHPLKDRILFVK
jgi:surface polysaccharide O-acyltransferase-like enzyme